MSPSTLRPSLAAQPRTIVEARRRLAPGFVIALAFSGGLAALQLGVPIFSLQVYERVLPTQNLATLLALCLLVLLLVAAAFLVDGLRALLLCRLANRLDNQLREPLSRASIAEPGEDDRGRDPLQELDELRAFVSSAMMTALMDLPWSGLFVVGIAMLDVRLAATALVSAVALVVAGWMTGRLQTRARRVMMRKMATISTTAERRVRDRDAAACGPGVIEALVRRELLDSRATAAARSPALERSQWAGAAARSLRSGSQVAMITVAATLAVGGAVSSGAIVAASMLAARALTPIDRLATGWPTLVTALRSAQRILAIINAAETARLTRSPIAYHGTTSPTGPITLNRVSVNGRHAGGPMLLDGVTLALKPGEIVAVSGRTGSGKSTFARLLVGAIKPSSGELMFDGLPLADWSLDVLSRHVGTLIQGTPFLCGTIAETIARYGDVDERLVVEAAEKVGVHKSILRLPERYLTPLGQFGHPISAGQAQLIALARAFYGDPRLIVLDEPTAGLDDMGEQRLCSALTAAQRGGATIVVITRKATIYTVADRMAIFHEGRLERIDAKKAGTDVAWSIPHGRPELALVAVGGR